MLLSKQLPSKLDVVPAFISEAVALVHKNIVLNPDQEFDVKLVLEEALTNAIRHGNRDHPQAHVDVQITLEGRRLTVKVGNQGEGFDVHKVPDPTAPERLMKTSGRGIFLMRKIMDEVSYGDNGRQLTLSKTF